jgi:hypothetical protein
MESAGWGFDFWINYMVCQFYLALFSYQASKNDITVYEALSKAPSAEYVNVSRWYNHIDALFLAIGRDNTFLKSAPGKISFR